MAVSTTIHMHDAGVLFLITVKDESGVVDLTTVQNLDLFFQRPDKSVFSKPCTTVNASAGLISYTTTYADLDQAGKWRIQVVVRFATDNVKHSDVGTLTVEKNIPL